MEDLEVCCSSEVSNCTNALTKLLPSSMVVLNERKKKVLDKFDYFVKLLYGHPTHISRCIQSLIWIRKLQIHNFFLINLAIFLSIEIHS